ncbi:hypothetical protein [Pseudooctadecabacter jejudonensis]|uniref:Uncharacterized protein n=1 Tax=Pseudooctadecabacter jejudonensis TaxID=1391910 RepID=A0A1Y5SFB3_9RHOB|nr:hypothetical protein [Pseudooctadecabacter jejudonensis]SLN39390.1 hypothetical protein PSJ8397_01945 [Pseudooctadecabacter jejudonensis]
MFRNWGYGHWGLLASCCYVAVVSSIVSWRWEAFKLLEPNAWGDFLAGAFGPLALAWVVLGFFQQGRELKNSVETLKLQAEELANSVKQQQELVAVSREAIAFEIDKYNSENEKSSQSMIPSLEIKIVGTGNSLAIGGTPEIVNSGGDAYDLEINGYSKQGSVGVFRNGISVLRSGETKRADSILEFNSNGLVDFTVFCRDRSGTQHCFSRKLTALNIGQQLRLQRTDSS